MGWQNYWKNVWNKFDCILLVTGLVDMAVTLAVGECQTRVSVCGAICRGGVGNDSQATWEYATGYRFHSVVMG